MLPSIESRLQSQLLDRRKKIERALAEVGEREHLAALLREVDVALEKISKGSYGMCETCHESIDTERLLADPLCRNCLEHLTVSERKALESDLDLAYQIQTALLPRRNLDVKGWTIAHHYDPAGPVSGDYFDLIPAPHDPGSVYFLVGDVSASRPSIRTPRRASPSWTCSATRAATSRRSTPLTDSTRTTAGTSTSPARC